MMMMMMIIIIMALKGEPQEHAQLYRTKASLPKHSTLSNQWLQSSRTAMNAASQTPAPTPGSRTAGDKKGGKETHSLLRRLPRKPVECFHLAAQMYLQSKRWWQQAEFKKKDFANERRGVNTEVTGNLHPLPTKQQKEMTVFSQLSSGKLKEQTIPLNKKPRTPTTALPVLVSVQSILHTPARITP